MQVHAAKQFLLIDVCPCLPGNTRRGRYGINGPNLVLLGAMDTTMAFGTLLLILRYGALLVKRACHNVDNVWRREFRWIYNWKLNKAAGLEME
jgi:hypothetical protein